MKASTRYAVERIQKGVRIEKRLLKVMKALAEYHDLTLGDLVEESSYTRLTAHARLGRKAEADCRNQGDYHLDLESKASHTLKERNPAPTLAEKPGRAGNAGIRRKS